MGRNTRITGGGRHREDLDAEPRSEPLPHGSKIRDLREQRVGVVLDHACQYSHPKAPPVYSYLIRWNDGQVQAVSEAALSPHFGLEVAD